ncbi:sphingosine kinase 2-like isoform X2 [Carex rostrata]
MAMDHPLEKQKMTTTNIKTQTETVTVSVNGSLSKASLSLLTEPGTRGGELRWHLIDHGRSRGEKSLDFDRDVLGVEIKIKRIVVKAFEIVAQKKSRLNCLGEKKRIRRDFVFEMETEEMATLWGRLISDCMNSLGRPQELFIIVNPFGGKKRGPKIFENEVKPLLEAAGINFKMQETRYRLHAREIAYSLDFTNYDGIVTVSGDGVLAEVVNGLLKREDWERAIKMPLGIIPGGTGNGMVKSLLHPVGDHYSASNATFAIIRGHKCSLDVASIVQGEKMLFSVLLLTWGLVADIDIESEKLRWMGNTRIEIYSLLRIFGLRRYNGKIRFVPAPGYEEYGDPVREPDGSKGETVISQAASVNGDGSKLRCYRGASTEFEASKWRFIDGPFVTVWIHNVPWASKDVMAAPKAQVKALQLEPGRRVGDSIVRGIIDMDGEVIARGDEATNLDPNLMDYGSPFLMKLDQGLATLFCPI